MQTSKEQMQIMHKMCLNELNFLKNNLEKFLEESERCQSLLNNELNISGGGGVANIFGLIVFDRYLTQMATVLNMARKFNIQLEINNLDQTVINASSNGCLDDANFNQTRLLKDFIQWRNNHLDKSVSYEDVNPSISGRIKMTEHLSELNEPEKTITFLKENNSNKKLIMCPKDTKEGNTIGHAFDTHEVNGMLQLILPKKSLDNFKSNYEFHAYIVYVRNFKKLEFFICQMEDYKTLFDLSCNCNFKPIPFSSLASDDVFCVLEERDTTVRQCLWRAMIVPSDNSKVSQKLVYLLDFGEIIPLTNRCTTYEAPQHYKEIPPLAIKCVLKGIEDSQLKSITNDQDKCEQLLRKYEFEKTAFRTVHKQNQVLHVLLLENSHNNVNSTEITNKKTSNPFLNTVFDHDDDSSSLGSAALQLPRSLLYQGSPIFQPSVEIRVEIGDKLQIIVTHIVSPISFYAIVQNDSCSEYKTFSWHDHQIFPLQKQLSATPQLNDIVLSQYVKDDYWYRAKIIDIDLEKDLFKVFYVDFGNTEMVPLSNLAKCSKEQLEDPLRAILFHLSNLSITTTTDKHNPSEIYRLKTSIKGATENMVVMMLDQIINVEVVERRNDELVVRLIDPQYAGIPKMLVNMGVVKEI